MRARSPWKVIVLCCVAASLAACGSIVVPEDPNDTAVQPPPPGDTHVAPDVVQPPADTTGPVDTTPPPAPGCQPGQCKIAGACFDDGASSASNPCNVCDVTIATDGWTARVCDDGDPCTTDSCSTGDGSCQAVPMDCGASNGCVERSCKAGKCVEEAGSCSDQNPCTEDDCDLETGECTNIWDDCDDGDPCTDDFCNTMDGGCDHFVAPGCGCVAACDGRMCGPDGCGGDCGFCGPGDVCDFNGQCVPEQGHLCGPVGPAGCCEPDGTVHSCNETGGVEVQDCKAQGLACGWVPSMGRYGCTTDGQPEPTGAQPQWCGAEPPPGGFCGDGVCAPPETCGACPKDCGSCGDVPPCCAERTTPGCEDTGIANCVCKQDAYCCETAWDATCVTEVSSLGCGTCPQP